MGAVDGAEVPSRDEDDVDEDADEHETEGEELEGCGGGVAEVPAEGEGSA